jgi:predicted transcriptional regulator
MWSFIGQLLKVSDHEQRVLDCLQTQDSITSKAVESLIRVKEVSPRRILKEMMDRGQIARHNSGRRTHYKKILSTDEMRSEDNKI